MFAATSTSKRPERTLAAHSDLEPRSGQIFTQTWNARAKADRLGVSYDTYIEHAFAFADRRTRKVAPWVNQLEGGPDARDSWAVALKELVLERHSMELGRIDLPQFRLKHDSNLPAQRAFREALISDIMTLGTPLHRSIARFVCQKRQLPLHAYLRRFERDVVLDAFRSIDRDDPEVRFSSAPALSIVDLMQSLLRYSGGRRRIGRAVRRLSAASLLSAYGGYRRAEDHWPQRISRSAPGSKAGEGQAPG